MTTEAKGSVPNLKSLERETPEFQALTPSQQNERRRLLSSVINMVVENPSGLGLTKQEAVLFICDFLEFHLTGKIERFPETTIGTKRKRRK